MCTDYIQLFITHRIGTQCVKCPFPATGIEQVQRYPHVIISCQDIVYKKYRKMLIWQPGPIKLFKILTLGLLLL